MITFFIADALDLNVPVILLLVSTLTSTCSVKKSHCKVHNIPVVQYIIIITVYAVPVAVLGGLAAAVGTTLAIWRAMKSLGGKG